MPAPTLYRKRIIPEECILLKDDRILYQDEVPSARRVLSAAAMTYVAGLLSVILQMLRLLLLFGGNRRDD